MRYIRVFSLSLGVGLEAEIKGKTVRPLYGIPAQRFGVDAVFERRYGKEVASLQGDAYRVDFFLLEQLGWQRIPDGERAQPQVVAVPYPKIRFSPVIVVFRCEFDSRIGCIGIIFRPCIGEVVTLESLQAAAFESIELIDLLLVSGNSL